MKITAGVQTRTYVDADERGVVDLLTLALGAGPAGRRPPEFFRWKHLENPFGRSLMLVAEADDRIVGLWAFMRWGFVAPDVKDPKLAPINDGKRSECLHCLSVSRLFVGRFIK